jgi:predicted dehydrogenase
MATFNRRIWIQSSLGSLAALSASSYLKAAGANERIRVAVIGRTGKGNYGHGIDEVWLKIPEAQIVAVADDDPEGLSKAAARLNAEKAFADYRVMLDEMKPDVVSICPRWVDKHHEMAMACAERGIHMYMEKPFVRTLAEADELVAACERTNTRLALACQSHYSPRVKQAQQLIADGKIGQVLEYRARGKEDHKRGGGEDLWVLGTHMLDLIRLFGGAPTSCFASLRQQGKPVEKADVLEGNEGLGPLAGDHVEAMYAMNDGATAYFASKRGMGKGAARFGLQIFGSEGMIEVMSGYLGDVKFLADPTWSPGRSSQAWQNVSSAGLDQPKLIEQADNREGNRIAVLDLIAAVKEGRQPLLNMYEARGALEMIHAVFESHRQQTKISLPLANRQHPLSMLS